MGEVVRAMDWSRTPLGPMESWPQSLLTTVSLCLASNFPISIAWGPERTQIYNDGYWPICGAKHPGSMGQDFRECWASAWPAIGEAFEAAAAGETRFLTNERMFLDRNGYLEETFFTFSFSPIRDESGNVGGLFHPVTELTQQSLAERRLEVLRALSEATSEAKTSAETFERVLRVLSEAPLDVPFALLYQVAGDALHLVGQTGVSPGAAFAPPRVPLAAVDGWPLGRVVAEARTVTADLRERFPGLRAGPYPEPPQTAILAPILLPGADAPHVVLVAGVSARRALDEPYAVFFRMLAEAVTNALTGARAYDAERARAEALAELDRAKTAFFSNVSHEFRTPLTLMLAPLEEALSGMDEPLGPRTAERLRLAHRHSLRLLKLVNTLLDFSRIEAGRVRAVYEPVDLGGFTRDLASNFRSAMERGGLSYRVDCRSTSPTFVDREMWEKIVFNLVSNAFKFTLAGDVSVTTFDDQGEFVLQVADTGTGIPADELPHVFERFHRVEGARGRTLEGTGIGLALVRELVGLHGGTVSVASGAGGGATFTVRVPQGSGHLPREGLGAKRALASTALGAAPFVEEALQWLGEPVGDAETNAVPVETHGARLLLADDNHDMRRYLERLLSPYWSVRVVSDGAAALEAARAFGADLVLADVMMPHLDGFALLRELRADERTKTIPVILLSARAGEEARVEGLEAGADDYLTKPFSARELVARIDAHLKLQQLRRETGAALQAAHDTFHRLVEHSPFGIYIVDADLRITHMNPGSQQGAFRHVRPAVGRDLADAMCILWPREVASEILATFRHTLESGEAYRSADFTRPRRDVGEVESYEWELHRIRLHDGRFGVVCYYFDSTQLHRARQALGDSEKRFRSLVTASTDVVYRMSPDWTRMLFFDGRDVIADTREPSGSWIARYVPTEDRAEVERVIRRAIETKSVFELEHRVIRPDGSVGWTFSRALPILDAAGDIVEWFGAATDVTPRRLAEEARERALRAADAARAEAEQASRAKDEFLATVSHELRAPLQGILGWLTLLRQGRLDRARMERALDAVERSVRLQAQVVGDIMDVSRVVAGKVELNPAPLDLTAVVESAVEEFLPAAAARSIRLDIAGGPAGIVMGDRERLHQVFANLLSNALKFTPAGGRVRVVCRRAAGRAVVTVEDSGQGIAPQFLPRLFDKFTQADSSSTRRHGGLGLGLAIVRHLTELQGGTVVAHSDGPGRGASFTVAFPELLHSEVAGDAAPAPARMPAATLDGVEILLVEDDRDALEAMTLVLEWKGARVRAASSVRDAWNAFTRRAPDVVLSDLSMPEEDGFALLQRIQDDGARVPAVALTGFARSEDAERVLTAGFKAHVSKPIDVERLVSILRDVLDGAAPARRLP